MGCFDSAGSSSGRSCSAQHDRTAHERLSGARAPLRMTGLFWVSPGGLRRAVVLIYADRTPCASFAARVRGISRMHRWTGRWLLLLALMGTFVPVALAVHAAPAAHACCVRKVQAHPCHGMTVAEPEQPTLRSMGCCGHDCCRASTTARWAYAASPALACVTRIVGWGETPSQPRLPATQYSTFQSSRAPPAC